MSCGRRYIRVAEHRCHGQHGYTVGLRAVLSQVAGALRSSSHREFSGRQPGP